MTFTRSGSFLALALILVVQGSADGIRVSKIAVPESIVVGESADLNCEWEEEGDHVYTMKWYQGINEIYRWTPSEMPSKKGFPLNHAFDVDVKHASRGRVRISNVTLAASGQYRCEVSGEGPYFRTSFDTATMTVVDVPDANPQMTGLKEIYRLRDVVEVNCTSYNAKPAPELNFYVDNDLADPDWITTYPEVSNGNGLLNVTQGLRFELSPSIPKSDRVSIKCTAAYPLLYWQSSDKVVKLDLPHFYPVTGEFPSEDHGQINSGGTLAYPRIALPTMAMLVSVCLTSYMR